MTIAPGQTFNTSIDIIAFTPGPQTFAVSGLPAGVTTTTVYYEPPSGQDNAEQEYKFVVPATVPNGGPYPVVFTSTDSNGEVAQSTLQLTIQGPCVPVSASSEDWSCGNPPDGCGGTLTLADSCPEYTKCDPTTYRCVSITPIKPPPCKPGTCT